MDATTSVVTPGNWKGLRYWFNISRLWNGDEADELKQHVESVPLLSVLLALASTVYLFEFVAHQDIFILFPGSVGIQAQAILNICVFAVQSMVGAYCLLRSLARIAPHFRSGGWFGVTMGIEMILFVLVFGLVEVVTVGGVIYVQGTNPTALFGSESLIDVHSTAYIIQSGGRGLMLFWAEVQVFFTHGDLPFDVPAAKEMARGVLGQWMKGDLRTLSRDKVSRDKVWALFGQMNGSTTMADLEIALNALEQGNLEENKAKIRQELSASFEATIAELKANLGEQIDNARSELTRFQMAVSAAVVSLTRGEEVPPEVLTVVPAMAHLLPARIGSARSAAPRQAKPEAEVDTNLPEGAIVERQRLYIGNVGAKLLTGRDKWDTYNKWLVATDGYDATKKRAPYLNFLLMLQANPVRQRVAVEANPELGIEAVAPLNIEALIAAARDYGKKPNLALVGAPERTEENTGEDAIERED